MILLLIGTVYEINALRARSSAEDYVALGNEMGISGGHIEAVKAFKNALKIDPYYIPAYLGLGMAYGNSGRSNEAIEIFKEGIKLNSTHYSVPQMQMGIALLAYNNLNDVKTAVQYTKKALQIFTDQGNYAGVALAAHRLKQFDPDP